MQIKGSMWTPEQFNNWLRLLLNADWSRDNGLICFSQRLTPQDVAHVALLQNVRIFLATLQEAGGTATTATGNLNRQFVNEMFERLILPNDYREKTREYCKVLNERDVWPLHILRILAELAGLIQRRAKRFKVIPAGRELMKEERIGELYHKLFLTYFRKFDLGYDFYLRSVPSIQEGMAVTLWRLDVVAQKWVKASTLAPHILLEAVLQDLRKAMRSKYDAEDWILGGYVLDPLLNLGLLEKKDPKMWDYKKAEIRVTPLWRKFIHFGARGISEPNVANN